ncbi:MAG: hypothetical protein NPIRA04_27220 [Nitrospirales bacterium]|nr:MAG: hypothetical protein NPIRA04_27220 [Nitrospirales bacterium]
MDDQQNLVSSGKSLEGQKFQLTDPEERRRVIDLAFDYRGDVTIELRSGESIEGYLYDRDLRSSPPTVKIFPKGQSSMQSLRYEELDTLAFSGEDTAFGKSWDDWVHKMEKISKKKL